MNSILITISFLCHFGDSGIAKMSCQKKLIECLLAEKNKNDDAIMKCYMKVIK